jgi:hypothetical protein
MATETEQLVVSLEARIRDFERNFEKANATATRNWTSITANSSRAARRLEADMAKASSGVVASFTRMGVGIKGALAFAGVGVGLREVSTAIRGVVAEAAKLVDTAETIGVTTKALQELRYAGSQAGVEVGDLDGALAKFSKQIGDASRGGGDLNEILKANGIAVRDQAGNVRPLIDLFRDYADLVSRASSAQEKNTLVTTAFGRSADDMGRMFDNGAAGIEAATAAANRLGLVIDGGKLQRIADIDDKWDAFASTLSTSVKSSILSVVSGLDLLLDRMNKVEDQEDRNVHDRLASVYDERNALGEQIADLQKQLGGGGLAPPAAMIVGHNLDVAKARLEELTDEALKLRDILDRRQGYNPPGTPAPAASADPAKPPAILPPSGGSGGGGGGRTKVDQVAAVIQALRFEGEQLGRTAEQQEVYNRLKAAGVTIDSEAGQTIAALVTKNEAAANALDKLTKAQEQFNETGTYIGEGVVSALDAVIVQGEDAGDVIANLAKQLASAALQASLLGTGPLAGIFGSSVSATGAPGGILGSLAGMLFGGFREGGGDVSPGKAYVIGEKRPELFVPRSAGTIVPSVGGKGANSLQINMPITVNGSAGTAEQNQDLAERIQRTMQPVMKGYVLDVIRQQMQPNGMLHR